jgi:hypothetical protein
MSIEMPFDQAESIVMTIPRLLSAALKMQTGDAQARYVFSVGNWSLELAKDQNYQILADPIATDVSKEIANATSKLSGVRTALTRGSETTPERY